MSFKPPREFDFSQPSAWVSWKDRFLRFRLATQLNDKEGAIQVSSLLYAMGSEADRIFATFDFVDDAARNDFDGVVKKFDDHFIPSRNVIHERANFHRRDQKQGESIEQYVRCLHELAEHTAFADKQDTIRDRLVLGVLDRDLSEKLQLKENLTLKDAVTLARQHERVKSELCQQRQMGTDSQVARVQMSGQFGKNFQRHRPKRFPQKKEEDKKKEGKCGKCGLVHERKACPAYGKQCRKCGKLSHFARVCYSKTEVSITLTRCAIVMVLTGT